MYVPFQAENARVQTPVATQAILGAPGELGMASARSECLTNARGAVQNPLTRVRCPHPRLTHS